MTGATFGPRELLNLPAQDQTMVIRLLPWVEAGRVAPKCEIFGERSAPAVYSLEELRVLIHALKAAQEEMERMVAP